MRAHEGTARRYAKALFQIARENASMPAVGDDLARFLERFDGDAQLHDVLTRPWIKGADRRAIAVAVAAGKGAAPRARFRRSPGRARPHGPLHGDHRRLPELRR